MMAKAVMNLKSNSFGVVVGNPKAGKLPVVRILVEFFGGQTILVRGPKTWWVEKNTLPVPDNETRIGRSLVEMSRQILGFRS